MGGKWKPLIVYNLMQGSQRYGALRRAVGKVSDKVLAQQLRELAADGIITRHDFAEIPPRVDYTLTPFGQSLAGALVQLCAWWAEHSGDLEAIAQRRSARLPEAFPLRETAASLSA